MNPLFATFFLMCMTSGYSQTTKFVFKDKSGNTINDSIIIQIIPETTEYYVSMLDTFQIECSSDTIRRIISLSPKPTMQDLYLVVEDDFVCDGKTHVILFTLAREAEPLERKGCRK